MKAFKSMSIEHRVLLKTFLLLFSIISSILGRAQNNYTSHCVCREKWTRSLECYLNPPPRHSVIEGRIPADESNGMCGIWDGSCVWASIHGLVVVGKQCLTVENKTKYLNVISCFDGTSVSKTFSKFQKQRGSEMSTDRPTDCGINFTLCWRARHQGITVTLACFLTSRRSRPRFKVHYGSTHPIKNRYNKYAGIFRLNPAMNHCKNMFSHTYITRFLNCIYISKRLVLRFWKV
jgi:hypothetical protein